MLNLVNDMLWPLLVCLALVGIHAYLGIHVIARKVIFVDLALAQIAALGAVYGVFLGLTFEEDTLAIKLVSVAFTLLGALLFSFTRTDNHRVPHEAIIGIIYAIAMSLTVLVTTNLPHGADEVRQMLAGSILWVTPSQVASAAALYAMIGVIHFFARKKFFILSNETDSAVFSPLAVKCWDFLFYATFGVVVTSSVGIAGVLLVFAYLIIPAVIGVMLAQTARARLLIGWAIGMIASLIGVVVSYEMDLPSGPVIVVVLAIFLVVVAFVYHVRAGGSLRLLSLKVGLFLILLTIVVMVPAMIFKNYHLSEAPHDHDTAFEVKDENDDFARIQQAQRLLKSGDKRGLLILKKIYEHSDSEFARIDAMEQLQGQMPKGPQSPSDFISWFNQVQDKIIYNKIEGRFEIADDVK